MDDLAEKAKVEAEQEAAELRAKEEEVLRSKVAEEASKQRALEKKAEVLSKVKQIAKQDGLVNLTISKVCRDHCCLNYVRSFREAFLRRSWKISRQYTARTYRQRSKTMSPTLWPTSLTICRSVPRKGRWTSRMRRRKSCR